MKHWAEEVLDEFAQEQQSQGVNVTGHYDPQSRVLSVRFSKADQAGVASLSIGDLEDAPIFGTDSPIFVRRSNLNTQLMLAGLRLGF